MNSELAYGEFIKPHVESENEKVTCGLKRFLTPNRFDQQKRQGDGYAFRTASPYISPYKRLLSPPPRMAESCEILLTRA